MAHCNTIFSQILKLVPRHEFEALAKQHHQGRAFRTASRWSLFVTLAMAQLSGRNSLRDMIENVSAQAHRLYHLGSAKLSRSNLSRIMGVSTIRPNQVVFSAALIVEADRLLYQAKAEGRNRVVAGECYVEQASEKRRIFATEEKTTV